MAEASENYGDRQLLHKKSRTTCCSCCASCCSCCIHCLSGFIFLLTIAGLVLCARIFLEFPVILNGFRSTMNVTMETIDALISDPQDSTYQLAPTFTCKMFVGSFQLLNTTTLLQYNDTSSADVQTAQNLQKMMNTTLNNSPLKGSYKKASVFWLRPNPTTVHFQMLFCNDNVTMSGIKGDNVVQILRNYSAIKENINISMNVDTLAVGVVAPCPIFLNSSRSWPWRVVLQQNQVTLCTGSLLSGFWVLSSANCVQNRDLSFLTIMMGDGRSYFSVDAIIIHPNFTASSDLNNFALIHLSTPVWFTSSIIPICLSQTSQDPTIGSVCNTLVWNSSVSGLSCLTGAIKSGLTCLRTVKYGSIFFQPSLTDVFLNQTDRGNALVCMNADGTAYLQGIPGYSSNSSPCLAFTSIGQTISWINSYLLT